MQRKEKEKIKKMSVLKGRDLDQFVLQALNLHSSMFVDLTQVYITGSAALREFTQSDWKYGDVDVCIVTAIDNRNIARKLGLGSSFNHRNTRSLYGEEFKSVGKLYVPKVGCIDLMTMEPKHDIMQVIDKRFDLNICRLAYQIVRVDVLTSYYAFLMCLKRLNVDMPKDVRVLISQIYIQHQARKKNQYGRRWFLGDTFDKAAALKTPGTFAVMNWRRTVGKEYDTVKVVSEGTRGRSRLRKYTNRGYEIAEFPSRVYTDSVMIPRHEFIELKALQEYQRQKKRRKENCLETIKSQL